VNKIINDVLSTTAHRLCQHVVYFLCIIDFTVHAWMRIHVHS